MEKKTLIIERKKGRKKERATERLENIMYMINIYSVNTDHFYKT